MSEPLKISVSLLSEQNFGDHGAMMRRDFEVVPGETVEDLVRRVMPGIGKKFQKPNPVDVIEIRLMTDAAGVVSGTLTDDWDVPPL